MVCMWVEHAWQEVGHTSTSELSIALKNCGARTTDLIRICAPDKIISTRRYKTVHGCVVSWMGTALSLSRGIELWHRIMCLITKKLATDTNIPVVYTRTHYQKKTYTERSWCLKKMHRNFTSGEATCTVFQKFQIRFLLRPIRHTCEWVIIPAGQIALSYDRGLIKVTRSDPS